jgi:hypothetical protein
MPGSKSDFLENELLDHVLGNAAYTAPANIYVGLFTAAPTDAGGGTECSAGNYARKSVTNNATNFPAASGGLKQNGAVIDFVTANADWAPPSTPVVAFGLFDAASSGNLLYWGWLGTDEGKLFTGLNAGDVLTVPGHALVNNDQVRLLAVPGASLPAGLSEGTTYFVISVSGITLQLSLTQGGAAVTLTGDGSGLIAKITSKAVQNGDTPSFAINALQIRED